MNAEARQSFRDESLHFTQLKNIPNFITPAPSALAAYGVLGLISIYYLLLYFDYASLPLSELLWNTFVHLVPASMVSILDPDFKTSSSPSPSANGAPSARFDSVLHANKSNSLRKSFGMTGTGIISAVNRGRRLSDLSSAFRSKPVTSLPGLGNWDHSCYQNSVIQGLASLRDFCNFVSTSQDDSRGPTTKALHNITDKLNREENAGQTFWTPGELKSMSSWQQQDAQEYFSKVMDSLDKDSASFRARRRRSLGLRDPTQRRQKVRVPDADSSVNSPKASQHRDLHSKMADLHFEKMKSPLDGLLAQRVGCQKCGYVEGLSLVPFNCLTLSLGREKFYDIRDCLDEYTALESISGVDCTRCSLVDAQARLSQLEIRVRDTARGEHSAGDELKDVDEIIRNTSERLKTISQVLEDRDFSDGILKKCQIPPQSHVKTTKSRQAVFAQPPQDLVIHLNRSIFDEVTGMQSKNYAAVDFPKLLDLGPWCLGSHKSSVHENSVEHWNTNPLESMLSPGELHHSDFAGPLYELRAVVTHAGRHENGHYICWRRSPYQFKAVERQHQSAEDEFPWWRLSDEDVTKASEATVMAQGGVFMLFYERLPPPPKSPVGIAMPDIPAITEIAEPSEVEALHDSQQSEAGPLSENVAVDTPNSIDSVQPLLANVEAPSTESGQSERVTTRRGASDASPVDASISQDQQDKETTPMRAPPRDSPRPMLNPRTGRGSPSRGDSLMRAMPGVVSAN